MALKDIHLLSKLKHSKHKIVKHQGVGMLAYSLNQTAPRPSIQNISSPAGFVLEHDELQDLPIEKMKIHGGSRIAVHKKIRPLKLKF